MMMKEWAFVFLSYISTCFLKTRGSRHGDLFVVFLRAPKRSNAI